MAGQWGTNRKYSSSEETVSKVATQCPLCKVNVVPRGITSTRFGTIVKADYARSETCCPNCGKNLTRTWSKLT